LKDLQRNGPVTIRVGEPGPLVACLIVESAAPGCRKLTREVRVQAEADFVELINDVDKERAPRPANGDYHERSAKESVNFAFEFNVPGGDMRLDLPLAVIRPEADQMPSACKNWFTVGRWADVANRNRGIEWVTLDAPLVEVGGITATLLNSQTNPDTWRKTVGPTQKLYSWAMNNHWGTNYRAYQEGLTRFRFILRPYRKSDPAENSRFAIGFSQPLLPLRARGAKPPKSSLLRLNSDDVLITALKPTDDGHAVIARLFGASGRAASLKLDWGGLKPKTVFTTDTSEKPRTKVGSRVSVPGYGLVSLRAEVD
jgi:alpha-mannosidase